MYAQGSYKEVSPSSSRNNTLRGGQNFPPAESPQRSRSFASRVYAPAARATMTAATKRHLFHRVQPAWLMRCVQLLYHLPRIPLAGIQPDQHGLGSTGIARDDHKGLQGAVCTVQRPVAQPSSCQ